MIQFFQTVIATSVPLVLVTLGGLLSFRVGVFHLGLEGLMIIGSFTSVLVTINTGSALLGMLAAVVACSAVSVLFWFVIVPLKANVIIAGLGLSAIGLAGTSFLLEATQGSQGAILAPVGLPSLPTMSGVLSVLSGASVLVLITPVLVMAVWLVVSRTRVGLIVRLVGEFPFAARSAGHRPFLVKLATLVACGAFCALGGTQLALGGLDSFSENMTAGRGYIAFSAVLLGAAGPLAAPAAAIFFGIAEATGIELQLNASNAIPREFILMLPYIITIAAVFMSSLFRPLRSEDSFSELRA